MVVIVAKYCGTAARDPQNHSMDAEYLRILLVKTDGEKQELFKGDEFDVFKWGQLTKREGYASYVDLVNHVGKCGV